MTPLSLVALAEAVELSVDFVSSICTASATTEIARAVAAFPGLVGTLRSSGGLFKEKIQTSMARFFCRLQERAGQFNLQPTVNLMYDTFFDAAPTPDQLLKKH